MEDLEGEVWKEVYDYGKGYWASNLGRIKSNKGRKNFKVLRFTNHKGGYLLLSVSYDKIHTKNLFTG